MAELVKICIINFYAAVCGISFVQSLTGHKQAFIIIVPKVALMNLPAFREFKFKMLQKCHLQVRDLQENSVSAQKRLLSD